MSGAEDLRGALANSALLGCLPPAPTPPRLRFVALAGFATVAAIAVAMTAWSVLAPLASAALAPAVVEVEGNRRAVQHLEGGIVRSLYARDGDWVEEDQVLLTMETARLTAAIETLRPLLAANMARRARFGSESRGLSNLDFTGVEDLAGVRLADFAPVAERQRRVFEARRAVLAARLEALEAARLSALTTARAHAAQAAAQRERLSLMERERETTRQLAASQTAAPLRLVQLDRAAAEIRAEVAQIVAWQAEALGRAEAARLDAARTTADAVAEAETELERLEAQHIEMRQQLTALQDQMRRAEVRSPVAGFVVRRAVHTEGGVVAPGATLMEIVPDARLVIVAEVRPNDVSGIAKGLPVEIRLSGLDGGVTPRVVGRVVDVSADRVLDSTGRGAPHFAVRVEAPPEARQTLRLRPGMTVDVAIVRGERTAFEYLGASLFASLARAMRE